MTKTLIRTGFELWHRRGSFDSCIQCLVCVLVWKDPHLRVRPFLFSWSVKSDLRAECRERARPRWGVMHARQQNSWKGIAGVRGHIEPLVDKLVVAVVDLGATVIDGCLDRQRGSFWIIRHRVSSLYRIWLSVWPERKSVIIWNFNCIALQQKGKQTHWR